MSPHARPEPGLETLWAPSLAEKASWLRRALADLGSVVVAFSGGVDSTYLAWVATDVLGDGALAVTADSPSYPAHHREMAERVAEAFSLRHEFIQTNELSRPEYRANPENRCYYCKQELFARLTSLARERGYAAVVDGNNADDRDDHRPGRQAAREFGVRSLLDEAALTKDEIRALSRAAGLPTWDEPASACLSSRIPYHTEVTTDRLERVDRAEAVLRRLGFRVVRVRHHDDVARIELGRDELARALDPDVRATVVREVKAVGYQFVTLDLEGYRLGSLNEPLRLHPL